ncbi:hypothetical protein PACTADRAFT_43319 [Pachysolen tannophilus NRRL Y-2460]|uniref:methionine--tRNA ligase n=1 Tax=Pachysolen tannophilus NRRL Y-2460 TaxID=669874 RepID=A0A1E4TTJ7_PACTA|nr:hypothetical protein PACTADRAFT_43319 [Pachysolen tannophilus NRRL Y-2460]
MSFELFGEKGGSILSVVNNLKIAVASSIFLPSLKLKFDEDQEKLALKDKKSEFRLIEPNAIVKYLGSISNNNTKSFFQKSSLIEYEESEIYSSLVNNNFENINFSKINIDKVDSKSVEQIILFSSLYPFVSKLNENEQPLWFKEFSKIPEVSQNIALITSTIKVERLKDVNDGHVNVEPGYEVKTFDGEILPKEGEKNILITSALPYVNNVPHLGNIVGSVLSADIYSRYCKSRNYNSLFICGTDEYGTATETKALEEKVSPMDLCTKYFKIHSDVYKWFQIGFDYFGRTTTDKQTEIAQEIFLKLNENGFLETQVMKQLYCPEHQGYLADRYVEGECPKCHYEDARGDQCDLCGNLLDPFELINPRCKLDNSRPEPRNSEHVFLSLQKLEPKLREWVEKASAEGNWSKNARTITNSWLNEGLKPRCITRDLKWGTPVPLEEFKDKVLYVWFDAPIGYISITANYSNDNWKKWWKNPENVQLYQFMGKDNVPFHTVVFPSTEIGTGENWTLLHHLSTTEYLQYEGGKFSKSRSIGVFGDNAEASGVPPSVWRYYLSSIRPETSDSQFSWAEFVSKNNNELLANLGNLVNRLVKFVNAKYNGVIPKTQINVTLIEGHEAVMADINSLLKQYVEEMEAVHLRKGLEIAMAISSRGNQFLQENKLDNSLYENSPAKCDAVILVGLNIIYLISAIISPYMPETTKQISEMLNAPLLKIPDEFKILLKEGHCINKAQYLFKRIDEKKVDEWRGRYGGKQEKEKKKEDSKKKK